METLELKKYLVLKGQAFFRDPASGVKLDRFSAETMYCQVPKVVKEHPEKYPTIMTALRLGHLVNTDTVPQVAPRQETKSLGHLAELLLLDLTTFTARVGNMKSLDTIDQLIDNEERRSQEAGGPRRQYLHILHHRRGTIMEASQKEVDEAYSSDQNPARPAVVARQEIKPRIAAKTVPVRPAKKRS